MNGVWESSGEWSHISESLASWVLTEPPYFSTGNWHTSGRSCLPPLPRVHHRGWFQEKLKRLIFITVPKRFQLNSILVKPKTVHLIDFWAENIQILLLWSNSTVHDPANGLLSLQMVSDVRGLFVVQHRECSRNQRSIQSPFVSHWPQHIGVSVGNSDPLYTHTDHQSPHWRNICYIWTLRNMS